IRYDAIDWTQSHTGLCRRYGSRLNSERYFHPVDRRVNRGGSVGLGAGASDSPEARRISSSSSESFGSPESWSTKSKECWDGISNFLPQLGQTTSSSSRNR